MFLLTDCSASSNCPISIFIIGQHLPKQDMEGLNIQSQQKIEFFVSFHHLKSPQINSQSILSLTLSYK